MHFTAACRHALVHFLTATAVCGQVGAQGLPPWREIRPAISFAVEARAAAATSGPAGQVGPGGGGPTGGGAKACQPGCKMPEPGSVQTNFPSVLTVIPPTASQIPFL